MQILLKVFHEIAKNDFVRDEKFLKCLKMLKMKNYTSGFNSNNGPRRESIVAQQLKYLNLSSG